MSIQQLTRLFIATQRGGWRPGKYPINIQIISKYIQLGVDANLTKIENGSRLRLQLSIVHRIEITWSPTPQPESFN